MLAHQYNNRTQTMLAHAKEVASISKDALESIGSGHIIELIAYLHDFGKEIEAFQIYLRTSSLDQYQKSDIDHAYAGAKYIMEQGVKIENKYSKLLSSIIAMAIAGHHTGLLDNININGEAKLLKRIQKNDNYEEAVNNFHNEILSEQQVIEKFNKAIEEFECLYQQIKNTEKENKECLFQFGLFQRTLISALMSADCDNTANFMNEKPFCLPNHDKLDFWMRMETNLHGYLDSLSSDSKINQNRRELSDLCYEAASNLDGIHQLYMPTGSGKTLTSMRMALHHAVLFHEQIEHIFYIVPFISILTQNAKTLREILFEKEIVTEQEFLEHYASLIADDEDTHRYYTEHWNSNIILTTLVQFLNSLFSGKKQCVRRMHQLNNSIIIVDEVQAIPTNIIHMFNSAMNYLKEVCNCKIILCTATQPRFESTQVPIRFSINKSIIKNFQHYYKEFHRVKVVDSTRVVPYTYGEASDFICEKLERSQSALVILNTKKDAFSLFQKLKSKGLADVSIYFLSTSLCRQHQLDILNEISQKLKRGEKVCCVSTQLIEAGVDLSFSFAVRAVAGLSNIAQAAGRVNRNGEYDIGYVYLMNLYNEELSRLTEIKDGKKITETILDIYRRKPEIYDHDLLSIKAMDAYFDAYYQVREKDMNYSCTIDKKPCDLYDLLSENRTGREAYQEMKHARFPVMAQAFQSAGEKFQVIDQGTIDVVVPYKEQGENLIARIADANIKSDELKQLLHEAQLYSISVYPNQLHEVEVISLGDTGAIALKDINYSKEFGFNIHGRAEGIIL